MCGIVGIVGTSPVAPRIYDALTMLQHRGQDAAGIATVTSLNQLVLRRAVGLVRDVFQEQHIHRLKGNSGIGHVRYPTAGAISAAEAQPFYVNSPYGILLGHNGNLTNAAELMLEVFEEDLRHINTTSDSEILLNVLATELHRTRSTSLSNQQVFDAVERVFARCRGAYAVVAWIVGFGMVAFRDPHGIRPLVYGSRVDSDGHIEWMVASETVALDVGGFKRVADVRPAGILIIRPDGSIDSHQMATTVPHTPCIFEHVYLARPDSVIDNTSVHRTRLQMGVRLGTRIVEQFPDHDIDVVIPIPDTSRTAAQEIASILQRPFREGFIKNRYIGRTFIMPGQEQRTRSVRQKLNPITPEFRDRNVLLVDDSIVRGTTCRQIVDMSREAGARKVYFASAAPPVRYPNVYGIDMPAADELIAAGRSNDDVRRIIGADRLFYQTLEDLIDACRSENPSIDQYETSIFTGKYVTADISEEYLGRLHAQRNDSIRSSTLYHQATLELL
jgi:amidophosphoribosyltransferase